MIDLTRIDMELIEGALKCYVDYLDGVIDLAYSGDDATNLANAEVLAVDRREAQELLERVSADLDANE